MRKSILLLLAIVLLAGLNFNCQKVPAGHVGIKVFLLGTKKGVDSKELGVGRYWIGINQELYKFPIFKQNYVWTKDKARQSPDDESITFQTSEGLKCNADIGITYHLQKDKVHNIFQKYRKGIEEITDIYMRQIVEDAIVKNASKYPVSSVYGEGKTELIKRVEDMVKFQMESEGIIIEKIRWIGDIRLPDTVIKALNLKIEAKQRAEQRENELREAKAEAQKKIAIARGEAQANQVRLSSITKSMIEYEKMLNERKALEKWDGKLPQIIGGNSPVPFIDVVVEK